MRYCILLAAILLAGCKHVPKKAILVNKPTHYDTILKERAAKRHKVDQEFISDSIRQDSVISKILQYADRHINSVYLEKI